MSQPRGFAEILLRDRLITQAQLDKALAAMKASGSKLIEALVSQGFMDEQNLVEFFSKNYRLPIMDLSNFNSDPEVIKLVPPALCQKHFFLPVGRRGDTLVIAVADPTNIQALDDIRFQIRLRV